MQKQTIFALCYRPGPAWLAGKTVFEQPLQAHLAYMRSLRDTAGIVLGGPYSDDTGGFIALEADSREAALAFVEGDPAIRDGVLQAEVHPWLIVGGRASKSGR